MSQRNSLSAGSSFIYGLQDDRPSNRILNVRVIKAIKLLKKDIFGLSDPYCKISLCSELGMNHGEDNIIGTFAETPAIAKNLNPYWNATFQFRVNPSRQYMLFQIFDKNILTADDFLGEVRFPLYQLPVNNTYVELNSSPVHDLVLKPRSRRSRVRGNLQIQFAYEPTPDSESIHSSQEIEDDADVQNGNWESLNQDPLPEGWEERVDFSGRVVYVDHVNRQVTLDRPTSSGAGESRRTVLERQHSSFENRRQISEGAESSRNDSIVDELISDSVDPAAPSAPVIEEQEEWEDLSSNLEEEPLLAGWEQRTDFSGRTVYINSSRRITQFERPTSRQAEDDLGFEHLNVEDHEAPITSTEVPSTFAVTNDEADPDSPLPEGWTKGLDPSTGRVFYIDHNSRTTSWTKPKIRTDGLYNSLGPLPPGWEMRNTPTGRPFFINHRTKGTTWDDPRQQEPLPAGWEMRVHSDGKVFYVDHTTKSTQWEDPRTTKVSSGPAIQYSRDYKIKYENFKNNLPKPASTTGKCDIKVCRSAILEDSFNSIMNKSKDDMYKRLWITFDGEAGLDYGGVAREWFYLLSKEMFNPYYGLFEYSAIDNYTLQINPNSALCNPDHLTYFRFFGRVCAMAVYHGKLVDGFFIRPFYKMMLGKPVLLDDMAEVDIETYNSLKWVIDNDPESLCLTFSAQEDKLGEIIEVPLVTNGEAIDVTNDNKMGYISAYIRWKFVDRISEQMESFKRGINDVIPLSNLAVFDENELEYLMCGLGEIDVNDWRENSVHKGGYSKTHHVVVWFWKAVLSFDNEFRTRLLQFVTGTSRVPMNGFAELQGSNGPQKFCIEKWGSPTDLPRAHTCFNRIDLPPYEDYHTLREKIRLAVECTGGFEID